MHTILPHMLKLGSYEAGIRPQNVREVIKLNQNENPYPPSPQVRGVLSKANWQELRCYPDPQMEELREGLAEVYRVRKERIFCGSGSSEIISLLFTVCVGHERRIAIPDPSFSLYASVAAVHQAECVKIPTRDDFSVDVDGLLECGAHAVMLVNPNNPTGVQLPLAEVERLVKHVKGLVVVDEAYIDFAESGSSAIPLIDQYEHVIVLRTFSKSYALSGARVGYAFANETLIAALEKAKHLYNINVLSQRLALAALSDQEYMKWRAALIRRNREWLSSQLRQLDFHVVPSQANFILCSPPPEGPYDARALYQKLMDRNLFVRYFEEPRLRGYVRISIGTDEQMKCTMDVIQDLFGE
ncbi:histidinol-phosphate transaminase [Marinicrinis lubricantis]|uniref:Histidinol-phosphate aminotransferase n=1 Tax=Marinicrinis lubricantis TaxID=2086470 RepID=A0ABW1IK29_9BACL